MTTNARRPFCRCSCGALPSINTASCSRARWPARHGSLPLFAWAPRTEAILGAAAAPAGVLGWRFAAAHYLQMRVMHDDYDFASALFYSVQDQENVAGAINFRAPGGDKHPSLDPVKYGAFTASRITMQCELAGVPYDAQLLADGVVAGAGAKLRPRARLAIELGGLHLHLHLLGAAFAEEPATLSLTREKNLLVISLDLLAEPRTFRWPESRRHGRVHSGGVYAAFSRRP